MTRKPKKVEFHFDERSQVTREEAEYLCARCGRPLAECKCGGEGVIHCAAGNTLVGFNDEQMKILQSYRLNEAQMKGEINRLRAALAKTDPIVRVYDGTLPVLECLHCGGRRGRFENEVQHAAGCIWEKAKEQLGS